MIEGGNDDVVAGRPQARHDIEEHHRVDPTGHSEDQSSSTRQEAPDGTDDV
jgi:hypothetical protein